MKKIVSILVTVALLVTMLCVFALPANADESRVLPTKSHNTIHTHASYTFPTSQTTLTPESKASTLLGSTINALSLSSYIIIFVIVLFVLLSFVILVVHNVKKKKNSAEDEE